MKNEKSQSPQKRSRFKRLVRVFGVLMFLGLVGVVILAIYLANTPSVITVSKETTRIVAPLDDLGNVDYIAALNEMSSEGVTPENNAAVLFVQAFGPSDISAKLRDEYFEKLGMSPLPEKGDYLVGSNKFIKQTKGKEPSEEQLEHLQQSRSRPWSAEELPYLAKWLEANKKPMQLIVEGTKRPRCYFPLVSLNEPPSLLTVLLPSVQQTREAARLLSTRAMLRLNEGKVDEAMQDLLACHRQSRLVGQHPTLIGALVAYAIDSIAAGGDAALIQHGNLTAAQAHWYQEELRKLGPFSSLIDKIDTTERFSFLDVVSSLVRGRPMNLSGLSVDDNRPGFGRQLQKIATRTVDWDEVLRMENDYFDRWIEAGRLGSFAERKAAFEELDRELRSDFGELRDPWTIAGSFFAGRSPRKTVTRHVGNAILGMMATAIHQVFEAENRAKTRSSLLQIGFALAAFRAEKGSYPTDLKQLEPKYIKKIPIDLYTEKSLHYQHSDDGFLLYSVGPNTKDDGGRTYDSEPEGDDIFLRIPVESVEQK